MTDNILDGHSVLLESDDMYALYFRLLLNALGKLQAVHDDGSYESKVTSDFVSRLLFTVSALRMKFTYSPAHNKNLCVDMADSGFPEREVISSLDIDLRLKEERLSRLAGKSELRQAVRDYLFRNLEDPASLLWQMSDRTYYEMIDTTKLFTTFTPGELVKRESSRKSLRSYTFSWGCYDIGTNRPYVHVMAFDQDSTEPPLADPYGPAYHAFLHVIKAEGSRAPDVGILAMRIDSDLEPIHPKVLKRVGIGPLYSPLLIKGRKEFTGPEEAAACSLLAKHANNPDDFCLFFTHEIVVSGGQNIEKLMFGGRKVRETFHFPADEPDAFRRRASQVVRCVLMPHLVRQNMDKKHEAAFELSKLRVYTYNERGEVHG